MGRRRFLTGVAGVGILSLASGTAVSRTSAVDHGVYEPPAGYTIQEIVTIFNRNLDAVPGWFRNAVLSSDEIVVLIFESATMDDGVVYPYTLDTDSTGRVTRIRNGAKLDTAGDRIVVSVTADAMDSIILADDPAAEARRQYRARDLRLESEGNFARGVLFWIAGAFDSFW